MARRKKQSVPENSGWDTKLASTTQRRQTTMQANIGRITNAQRYNGGGKYGSGGGGRYIGERNNGRATNSGRRNTTLGNRDQKRADLRAAFADSKFADGTGRAFSKG